MSAIRTRHDKTTLLVTKGDKTYKKILNKSNATLAPCLHLLATFGLECRTLACKKNTICKKVGGGGGAAQVPPCPSPSAAYASSSSSLTILSHWILHMSMHCRLAFRQQHWFSTQYVILHVQESSSRTSSGAGLDPSHTNSTAFEISSTSQPYPRGERINESE